MPAEAPVPGRVLSAFFALACLASSVEAAPRLLDAAEAPPLSGWVGFCERQPEECLVDTSEPEAVALTDDLAELLAAVNRHVNASVRPMRDQDRWGVVEFWGLPDDGYGDCEDFQLIKRKLLVEAGLPRRALRMTVVLDATGEGHAVLTVRTTRGDLVLDNQTDEILAWQETGYRFVQRESAQKTGWVYLEREAAPLVTAMAQ
jgi:predicted transglutaminase-like cysteine proteinase